MLVKPLTQKRTILVQKPLHFILNSLHSLHDFSGSPDPEQTPGSFSRNKQPQVPGPHSSPFPWRRTLPLAIPSLARQTPVISILSRGDRATFFVSFISWGAPADTGLQTCCLSCPPRDNVAVHLKSPAESHSRESTWKAIHSSHQREEPCYNIYQNSTE